jgi:hypothetical protein
MITLTEGLNTVWALSTNKKKVIESSSHPETGLFRAGGKHTAQYTCGKHSSVFVQEKNIY